MYKDMFEMFVTGLGEGGETRDRFLEFQMHWSQFVSWAEGGHIMMALLLLLFELCRSLFPSMFYNQNLKATLYDVPLQRPLK